MEGGAQVEYREQGGCEAALGWLSWASALLPASQVLELPEEPGGFPPQLHEVHHQPSLPAFPFHCGLRSVGDAAVWGTVSSPGLGGQARGGWTQSFPTCFLPEGSPVGLGLLRAPAVSTLVSGTQ